MEPPLRRMAPDQPGMGISSAHDKFIARVTRSLGLDVDGVQPMLLQSPFVPPVTSCAPPSQSQRYGTGVLRDNSVSDEIFFVSACSHAGFVSHADTDQVDDSCFGGPVASCQNTHAHSAYAVPTDAKIMNASESETRRTWDVMPACRARTLSHHG